MLTRLKFGTRAEPIPSISKQTESLEVFDRVRPRWKQVHGVSIAEVCSPAQECGEVDGLWTKTNDLPIAIVTADCVPILFRRGDEKAIGGIHAGWMGTKAGIATEFFKALPTELSNPYEWIASIGPCIHACCYQVSEALIAEFVHAFPNLDPRKIEPQHRMLDLVYVNQKILEDLGVKIESVSEDCTFCTKSETNPEERKYFSYRGGDRKSRMLSIIEMLK